MTKVEFLDKLKSKLGHMPYSEVEKIINYYTELIDDKIEDNLEEKDVIKSLGSIDKIVKDIENDNDTINVVSKRVKNVYDNSDKKVLWMLLLVFGFPIWISILAVLGSLYLTVLILFLTLFIILISFLISGIVMIFSGFSFSVINMYTSILSFGLGFVFIGLSFLLFKPSVSLIKLFFKGQNILINKIRNSFSNREVV